MRHALAATLGGALAACGAPNSATTTNTASTVAAVPSASATCPTPNPEAARLFKAAADMVKLDPRSAIEKYRAAIELEPREHRYVYALAQALQKMEKWDEVAATIARAVELAPGFANYWFSLGWAREQLAKKQPSPQAYEQAEVAYGKCVAADPNHDECAFRQAVATLYLDRPDSEQKALQLATHAIEIRPDDVPHYAWLADLYRRLDLPEQTAKVLEAAKSAAKPGDRELYAIHLLGAELHMQGGRLEQAVQELQAAKDLGGEDHPQILFQLGSALAAMGDTHKTEAVAALKGFCRRACKGGSAEKWKVECERAAELALRFGESCG